MKQRRRTGRRVPTLVALVLLAGLLVPATATARRGASDPVAATGDRIPLDQWTARQDEYLAFADSKPLSPGDALSIVAHAEYAERTGGTWDSSAPTVADFQGTFDALDTFKDTNDFRINSLLLLTLTHGDELSPELQQAIKDHILSFKYWYTEPTPPGIVDSQYYWTENHYIVYLSDELIAGELYPDEVFTNSGMTGRQHQEHARQMILRWLALRARFGFSEWLSDVYWNEDYMGLLLLADHAQDPVIAAYAAQMLDSMYVELASHLHDGSMGVTHGRSYNKDKMTALDEDVYNNAKLVFDTSPLPYTGIDRATEIAVASRYRPPEVTRKIASDDSEIVVRQKQGVAIDPLAPVVADPVAPYGLSYSDPMVWWAQGAQLAWPVVPLSVELLTKYNLWETSNFQQVAALKPIVESTPIPGLQALSQALGGQLNLGLLSEANTMTWRSADAMLSSVQGYRPGQRAEQDHIWQATLDPNAEVFTTHPTEGLPNTTDWHVDTGYWTGDASMPWTVQSRNTLIAQYAPQYDSDPNGLAGLQDYLPFTHAYFPTDHFDQVVQQDGWTIGRRGDGYVALWSWRPATWKAHDPATEPTNGMTGPFDLVADGGPDNVWITEVGRASQYPGADPFQAFVQAVTSAPVEVTPLAQPGAQHTIHDGFAVRYASPSQGELATSWEQPLTVDGTQVPLATDDRWDSPYATVPWGAMCYDAAAGGSTLHLDFSALTPLITDPEAAPSAGGCTPVSTTTTTTVTGGTSPAAVPVNAGAKFTG